MIVQFTAPFLDHSGYGEASRNTLMAMISAGIKVTTKIASFTPDMLNVGVAGKIAKKLEKKFKNYRINLIELTPEHFQFFKEKNTYNIGYFFWEVVGIDPKWIKWCNLLDEIWLPSPFFAEMFRAAGVKKPIYVIPCCMDMDLSGYRPYPINLDKPKIIFYSIFQWTERKNPKALIESYLKEFEGNDDVVLLIKTYRSNFSESEKQAIKNIISEWKKGLKLKHNPKIWLVLDDMTQEEIMRFHKTGDVFVSSHRGEGWGYSQMVAMAIGNPVISTNFGGIHEYLSLDTAELIDYKLSKVSGMNHIPWYNSEQKWASINEKSLQASFRKAYIDKKGMQIKSQKAKKNVRSNFNYKKVGLIIRKRLESIISEIS